MLSVVGHNKYVLKEKKSTLHTLSEKNNNNTNNNNNC